MTATSAARAPFVRVVLVALSIVLCIAATPMVAAADEGTEAIHLRVDIEPALAQQCPRPDRFLELLRAELPGLRLASEETSARTFAVRIRRGRGSLEGEVVVTGIDGRTSTRTVAAQDCPTLTRALAVVAAVASHAAAADAPKLDLEPPKARTRDATSQSGGGPSDEDVASETSPAGPPHAVDAVTTRQHGAAWIFGAGLGTELVLGALPRSTMGYRAYFDAQRGLGLLAVGVRSSFAFATAQQPGISSPNVSIQMWTARVEGCAHRRAQAAVSVELCGSVTSGVFDASSSELSDTHVFPWLSFGGGGRARWYIGKAAHAEVFGNVSLPTTRFDTVSRDPTVAVRSTVSPLVGEVGLGIGYSFGGR